MEGVSPSCLKSDYSHLSCSRFTFCTITPLSSHPHHAHQTQRGATESPARRTLSSINCSAKSTTLPYIHAARTGERLSLYTTSLTEVLNRSIPAFLQSLATPGISSKRAMLQLHLLHCVVPAQQQGQSSEMEIHVFSKTNNIR